VSRTEGDGWRGGRRGEGIGELRRDVEETEGEEEEEEGGEEEEEEEEDRHVIKRFGGTRKRVRSCCARPV